MGGSSTEYAGAFHQQSLMKQSTTNKDDRKVDFESNQLPKQLSSDKKVAKEQTQIISFFEQEYRNV